MHDDHDFLNAKMRKKLGVCEQVGRLCRSIDRAKVNRRGNKPNIHAAGSLGKTRMVKKGGVGNHLG